MVIAGPSRFAERFMNSIIIGLGSTFLCTPPGAGAAVKTRPRAPFFFGADGARTH